MTSAAGPAAIGCVMLSALAAVTGAQVPETRRETIPGTLVTFELVRVPGGSVTLEAGGGPRAVVVNDFFIGRTEVTWDLYDAYALGQVGAAPAGAKAGQADAVARPSEPYGAPDRGWGHAGYPAMSLTREAAEAFCWWLSARTGKAYRLPTEAEWQRAATLAAGAAGLTDLDRDARAWHAGNARGTTHPVGRRAPDALGLFDLFGNVAEWVATADGARVVRGGSFRDAPRDVGPHARAIQDPTWNETDPQLPKSRWWLSDAPFAGFRIALEVPVRQEGDRHARTDTPSRHSPDVP